MSYSFQALDVLKMTAEKIKNYFFINSLKIVKLLFFNIRTIMEINYTCPK